MTDYDLLMSKPIIDAIKKIEERAKRPAYDTGTITSVDPTSRVAMVAIDGGGSVPLPVIDDSYVPQIGHQVIITKNGDEAVGISPPKGPSASVLINGSGELPISEDAPDGGFEAGISQILAGTNTTLTQDAVTFRSGVKSLKIVRNTSTGDGTARLQAAERPFCTPGKHYYIAIWSRAGTSTRTQRIDIEFYDAAGTVLDTFMSPTAANSNAAWTQYWMSGLAPEGAVTYGPVIHSSTLATAVVGEAHYFDDLEMHVAVPGMGVTGADADLFDATDEGWSNVTWTTDGALSGGGCVVTNAFASTATSPTGVSGTPVVAGKKYTAFAYVNPVEGNGTERQVKMSIRWYNGAGTFLSQTDGATVLSRSGVYVECVVPTTTAPATAAFAARRITITSPGITQQWRIDTAVLTIPGNARIRVNTDPTYIDAGHTASIEMRTLGSGLAIVNFPEGLDGDMSTPIPVVPNDSWRVSCRFINEATNSVFRNVALVATWYDANGDFFGIDLHLTPISTNPSTWWQGTTETFLVPPAAAFMRVRIVVISGAANEAIYLSDVIAQRVSLTDAKVLTRGPVYALKAEASFNGVSIPTHDNAAGWVMSPWFLVTENPGVPLTVEAILIGSSQADAGFDYEQSRVGITFDGGFTWTYGDEPWSKTDAGYLDICTIAPKHVRTDLPIGDIYCWFEQLVYGFHTAHAFGRLTWRTNPA